MTIASNWPRWCKENFLLVDFLLVFLTSLVAVLLVESCGWDESLGAFLKGSRQTAYGSVISLSASMLGFVIAAVPIILAFMTSSKLSQLRDHFQEVFDVFFQAIRWLSLLLVVAIASLLADKDSDPVRWLTYATATLFLIAAARVYRVVWILRGVSTAAVLEMLQQKSQVR